MALTERELSNEAQAELDLGKAPPRELSSEAQAELDLGKAPPRKLSSEAQAELDVEKVLKISPVDTSDERYLLKRGVAAKKADLGAMMYSGGEGAIDRIAREAAAAKIGPPAPLATDAPPVGSPDTGIENPALYREPAAQPRQPPAAATEARATPTESVPSVAAESKATEGGEPAFGGQTFGVKPPAAKEAVKEKGFADKLGEMAKKFGIPLLHLIQAGAYGYAGIDKPTVLEQLRAQQAERAKTKEGQEFQLKTTRMSQEYASRMADIDRMYQKEMAVAKSAEELAAAKLKREGEVADLKQTLDAAQLRAQTMGSASGGAAPTPQQWAGIP